ncbi:hypothetical protein C9980_19420 [Vibrio mediterranei]|nr:hypothetical protein C9980_19420 [Vibrio mediterranei]
MPNWPTKGFENLDSSRRWVEAFVRWYNTEHKHSKLNYVTPSERHNGKDEEILITSMRSGARSSCINIDKGATCESS